MSYSIEGASITEERDTVRSTRWEPGDATAAGGPYTRFRDFGPAQMAALAGDFAAARPFPHVVIPDFLRVPPAQVLPAFPAPDDPGWRRHTDAYEAEKTSFGDLDRMAEPLASMVRELNSTAYLQFLEQVTGITGLLPDPYLQGAGLHCTGPGGVCAPHTDNHVNERLSIFRRVNTLLYLNPGWEESTGGCLELYNRQRSLTVGRTIVPSWGTCVIFQSDGHSIHGFSRPVAVGHFRRAIAVYHYTSLGAATFSGGSMTDWWHHDEPWKRTGARVVVRHAHMHLYRSLRFAAKAFAYLAHRARPTLPPRQSRHVPQPPDRRRPGESGTKVTS
jgi:Rps23 Pro-64 3,4-dihydroxylase Tpa1-like proline 4-hydroxylase